MHDKKDGSKGNIIMVTDGASIPDPREWRLINAWSIALAGAVCTLFALCLLWPEPYLRILLYLPDGVLITFKITMDAALQQGLGLYAAAWRRRPDARFGIRRAQCQLSEEKA